MLMHVPMKGFFRRILDQWYLVLMCFLLVLRLFFWFSPSHAEKINMLYLWPTVIAAAALQIRGRTAPLPKGFALLAGLFLWLLLSCVVNGDPYLIYNRTFILYMFIVLICYSLVIPTAREGSRRAAFLSLAAVYCSLLLLLALLGLYAAMTGSPVQTRFSDTAIQVLDERLYFFQYHPNEAASALAIGLFLFLYLALENRRLLVKVALTLCAVLLGVVIALTGSRTSMLIAAGGVGACVFWIAYTLLAKRPFWLRWPVGLAAFCAIALLSYQGMILSIDGVASVAASHRAAPEAALPAKAEIREEISGEEEPPPPPPPAEIAPVVGMNDDRREFRDLGTFNMRTDLWRSGIRYMHSHPKSFVFGLPDNVVSRVPSTIGRRESHMHNAYLETLLLGGVPGLLLYLGYLGIVFHACFRLAFHKSSSLPYRFLGMIPLFIAVNGLMEIYPLFSGNVMDMMSFAISGMVVVVAGSLRKAAKPGLPQGLA